MGEPCQKHTWDRESDKISIPHVVDLLELLHGFGIVTRHDHRLAIPFRQRKKKRRDGFGVFGVEIAGGLVGKDEARRGILDALGSVKQRCQSDTH